MKPTSYSDLQLAGTTFRWERWPEGAACDAPECRVTAVGGYVGTIATGPKPGQLRLCRECARRRADGMPGTVLIAGRVHPATVTEWVPSEPGTVRLSVEDLDPSDDDGSPSRPVAVEQFTPRSEEAAYPATQ